MPELQRRAYFSPGRKSAQMPLVRPHRASSAKMPEMLRLLNSICRLWDRESRECGAEDFPVSNGCKNGRRFDDPERCLSHDSAIVSNWQNRHPGGHTNDCQGA